MSKPVCLLGVVLLALPAVAVAGARAAAPCSRATAKRVILAAPQLASIRPTVRQRVGGVDELFCHDLTGDGRIDMAATIASGGTAGDTAWVVFRRARGRWQLAYKQLRTYKVGLVRTGRDLIETTPVYLAHDPNCCPTGGFDHRRFHWNGARLVVVRSWHDKQPFPAGVHG